MSEKIQIPTAAGQNLTALLRLYESEAVLNREDLLIVMAHGFPGHKAGNNDLFGDLEFLLADKGFNTLRFDFRGCGESDGKPEMFTLSSAKQDFCATLEWAISKKFKRFIYVGEGLGAALCVMNADLNVQAMVLLWPLFDMQDFYKANFSALELSEHDSQRDYIEKNGQVYGLPLLSELRKTSLATKLKDVFMPALIMHGARDTVIPVTHLGIARQNMNARRLEITTFHDGEHGLGKLNHRKAMFHHIVQFVAKYG